MNICIREAFALHKTSLIRCYMAISQKAKLWQEETILDKKGSRSCVTPANMYRFVTGHNVIVLSLNIV